MLCTKRPKECNGTGQCYRRYTKYYYYQHENVICQHDCKLIPCTGCNYPYPQWHYDLFSSGQCYNCNKQVHESEIDSEEEELRSDASLDSGGSVSSLDKNSRQTIKIFSEYVYEQNEKKDDAEENRQKQ